MKYIKNIESESVIEELNELVDRTIKAYKMGACWRGKVKAIYIGTSFLYNHNSDESVDGFLARYELLNAIGFNKLYEYEEIANYIDELFEM